MKRITINRMSLLAVAGLMVLMTGIATAGSTSSSSMTSSSKDVNKLKAEITMLNSDANLPQGEKTIAKQLTDSFSVASDKVNTLLARSMQYGEVAAILAFADKMPGGLTDANINQVMSMKSKGEWDQVAKNLNVNVSEVASKLSSLEDSAHKSIKQAYADSLSTGKGAGGGGISESPHGDMGESGGATGGSGWDSGTGGMSGGTGTDSGTGGMSGGTGTDSGTGGTMGGTGTDSGTTGGSSGGSTGGSYGY